MGRIIALDWGENRVGVAVSDEEKIFAHQVPVKLKRNAGFFRDFKNLLRQYPAEKLVVGLPKALSGKVSFSQRSAEAFGGELAQKFGLPVEFVDERFSSLLAAQKLNESRVPPRARKGQVDNLAAQILLQGYLDKHRPA